MKLTEINNIIEESLTEEVKGRIITEQESGNKIVDMIHKLGSISPFMNKISKITDIASGFGKIINLDDINISDFLKHSETDDLKTGLDKIYKNIIKEIGQLGIDGMFDVDVGYDSNDNDNLDIKIKITSDEPLGSEKTNDMENTEIQEFVECLLKARENKEDKFNVQGKEYDVNEWYSHLAEGLEEECDECDEEVVETEVKEQEGGGDPGEVYFNQVMNQRKQDNVESELSGNNGGIEDTTSNFAVANGHGLNENKKVVRLTEDKFIKMLTRIVTEALKPKVVGKDPKVDTITKPFKDATKSELSNAETHQPKNVPGLDAVKKAHDKEDKEGDDHFNEVDKKLKDYLSFEGNTNPEFPHQISEEDNEIVANRDGEFGDDAQEYVDTYRGMGPQDAAYDIKPSPEFVDRVKKALTGDSTMGNASGKDVVNATESDVGEKVFKNIEKKRKNIADDPMYVKDEQPIEDDPKYKKETNDPGFETVSEEKKPEESEVITEAEPENTVVNEEIDRMKSIYSYNKKTQ